MIIDSFIKIISTSRMSSMKKFKPSMKSAQTPRNAKEIIQQGKEIREKEEREMERVQYEEEMKKKIEEEAKIIEMRKLEELRMQRESKLKISKKFKSSSDRKSSSTLADDSLFDSSKKLSRLRKEGDNDDDDIKIKGEYDDTDGYDDKYVSLFQSEGYTGEEDENEQNKKLFPTWKSVANHHDMISNRFDPIMLPFAPIDFGRAAKPPGYYAAQLKEKKKNGLFIVQLPTKFPFKEREGAAPAKPRPRASSTMSVDVKVEPPSGDLGAVSSTIEPSSSTQTVESPSAIDLGVFK